MRTAPEPGLAALLRRLDPGVRLLRSEPLAGGISARVTALEVATSHGTERWVLREPPDDEDLDAAAELALLRYLRAHGLPVPEPLGLLRAAPSDPDNPLRRDAVLIRHVDHDGAVPIPAGGLERMGALLAEVHALPPADAPPLPPWRIPEVPATLPDVEPRRAERLCAASRAHAPSAATSRSRRCLCHRDLWTGNLLWRGPRIAALLDWEEARLADPLEDLAIARLELAWVADLPRVARFTKAWVSARGEALDATDLAAWDLRAALVRIDWMARWPLAPDVRMQMRRIAVAMATRAAEALGAR